MLALRDQLLMWRGRGYEDIDCCTGGSDAGYLLLTLFITVAVIWMIGMNVKDKNYSEALVMLPYGAVFAGVFWVIYFWG